MGQIKFVKRKVKKQNCTELFHDYKSDINQLIVIVHEQKDKINELIAVVNKLTYKN